MTEQEMTDVDFKVSRKAEITEKMDRLKEAIHMIENEKRSAPGAGEKLAELKAELQRLQDEDAESDQL